MAEAKNKTNSNKKKNYNKKKNSGITEAKVKIEKEIVKEVEKKEEVEVKKTKAKNKTFVDRLFKPKYALFDIVIFVIIALLVGILSTGLYLNKKYKSSALLRTINNINDKEINDFLSSYDEIVKNYYEDINKKELISAAISGMVSYLDDNYSTHMDDLESSIFDDSLDGTYNGIGIVISGLEIIEVYKNTPAEEAGLQVGDIIKSIDGIGITQENLIEAVDNIKGSNKKDTTIVVTRDKKELSFEMKTRKVDLPIVTNNYAEYENKKIGYIKVNSFTSNSYDLFKEQLEELEKKKIDRLIIDLRSNSGGYLDKATDIASLFIEKGKTLYTLEKKNKKEKVLDKTNDKRDYKIVVLINCSTASASEILAASLRDNNGAILVGEKSYGKGKVQNTKKLADGTILKYTSAKWLTPKGEAIDEVGLTPEYEVTNSEEEDTQYEKALELMKEE